MNASSSKEPETPQWHFRCLFDALLEHSDEDVSPAVLTPWLNEHGVECASWLKSFSSARGDPVPPAHVEELNCLYAASRVSQLLLTRFQPQRGPFHQGGPHISLADYTDFFSQLGMTLAKPAEYSPFYHEIVDVIQAPDSMQTPQIVRTMWPCLMLGPMMFSRAGVCISVGDAIMNKEVAESSLIYWSYLRLNRQYEDLSHGWGSNSQWRTAFRRDYLIEGDFCLNVDGRCHVSMELEGDEGDFLPLEQRIELVKYHHFVKRNSAIYTEGHPWPYEYSLRMSGNDPLIVSPLGFAVGTGVAVIPHL